MKKREAFKEMLLFAEGKITTAEFWAIYEENKVLQNILIDDKTRPLGVYVYDSEKGELRYDKKKPIDSLYYFAPERLSMVLDITKLEHRYELYEIVRRYFWRRKKKLNYYNKDAEEYLLLLQMLPDYVEIRDEIFLRKIMDSAPKTVSKAEKLSYCRKKIKEMFRYDKKPPEWLQSPEWPIVQEKPLVFARQETDKNNEDRELYFFYDQETKEETIVEQFA